MNDNTLTTTNFAESICPKHFDVCGWQLKPFCLGHFLLLERIKSPVVNVNEEKTLPIETFQLSVKEQYQKLTSFFTAVLICAMDYELGEKALRDDVLMEKVAKQFMEVVMQDMKRANWNYPREFYVFKQYIKYSFNIPPFQLKRRQPKYPSGTNWKDALYGVFKKLGYTERDILNMPLNRLFQEWTIEGESNGVLTVKNTMQVKIDELFNAGKQIKKEDLEKVL